MHIDAFTKLLTDPKRGMSDLLAMRDNAIAKNAVSHISAAEHALDHRFPTWRKPASNRGKSHPTEANFNGKTEAFDSEKQAYIWLLERFIQFYPKLFEVVDWETEYVVKGKRTVYFARSLLKLFKTAPDHATDPNKYYRMTNGWFAKLVLSEEQKVSLLLKFATMANLRMGVDWDWNQRAARNPLLTAEELLREIAGEV